MSAKFRVGTAIAALYLAVAVLTVAVTHRPFLPLFEGIGAPAPYQWVEPPEEFTAGNTAPKPVSQALPIGRTGNASASVSAPDGQFSVTFGPSAIPARDGVTTATVTITPLGPSAIGKLPRSFADGNAYRLDVRYADGTVLDRFAAPASVLLRAPTTADAGLYQRVRTGDAWTRLRVFPATLPNHYSLQVQAPGVFAAAMRQEVYNLSVTGAGKGSPLAAILVSVAVGLLLVGGIAFAYRRFIVNAR